MSCPFLRSKAALWSATIYHVGIFLELVVEACHALDVGAGALDAFDDDDVALLAELLGHSLGHLHAHCVVAHADEAGVGRGNVLVEGDDRYPGLLGLLHHRRQACGIGRLQAR